VERQSREESEVSFIDHPDGKDVVVVGRVHVHSRAPKWLPFLLESERKMLSSLKREAADLDAEFLFDIRRYSRSQFEWREEHLMGTAGISRE